MKAARPTNIVSVGGGWSGVSESIGYLAEHDPDRADFFRTQAEHWFNEEMKLGYAGEGWGYLRTMYDHHAKQRVPMSKEVLERFKDWINDIVDGLDDQRNKDKRREISERIFEMLWDLIDKKYTKTAAMEEISERSEIEFGKKMTFEAVRQNLYRYRDKRSRLI